MRERSSLRRRVERRQPEDGSPETDATRVDVDEIGGWIVADAAELQRARRRAKVIQLDSRNADVDGFTVLMEASRSHTGLRPAARPEHRVRMRRAVPRNDVERPIRLQRAAKFMKQIEQVRIDGFDFVGSKVPQ